MTLQAGLARRVLANGLAVAMVLAVAGCGSGGDDSVRYEPYARVPAEQATGLAVGADGTLYVGERLTGRVLEVDPDTGDSTAVATVGPLDTAPRQRGLLSLAVTSDGTVLASSTTSGGRLVVEPVAGLASSDTWKRWTGPTAADQANGGRLAVLRDGSVVIGIGDLLDHRSVSDPTKPNGKLLRLEPDGTDRVIAGGFNNPFAIVADGEALWVADNAPRQRSERLLRVRGGRVTEVGTWDETRVPSGLAVTTNGSLAFCSYAGSELRIVDPEHGDDPGELVAEGCRYGVVSLGAGRIAFATENQVVLLRPAQH